MTWPCHICNGTRYRPEILQITFREKNIADVLDMTVSEAVHFYESETSITGPLKILEKVGMGYVTLGQSAVTISGGEAQRIKLAKELGRNRTGNILYILDEPTTGLSCVDSNRLMVVLRKLVDKGNSVLVIEHDLSVLAACDWVIELGPSGGSEGGEVIAEGSPDMLANISSSIIGTYFKKGAMYD